MCSVEACPVLEVFLYDALVGTLETRGRGIRFTYAPRALDDTLLPALSVALPKRAGPFPDSQAGPYFRNLLPEQAYRRLVAAAAGAAADNAPALLGAIGAECPGAVSIWPAGERPATGSSYRELSAAELGELVAGADAGALARAVARGRLSLPGVQEKIALLRDDGGWRLPLGGGVTSHILKASAPAFPRLLENELFCMALAAASGLNVAPAGLADPAVRVISVERFDRVRPTGGGGEPRRKVHQEDFCQALRVDPERKYQFDGGPGLKQCAAAIRAHSALPARDLDRLARWVCFNYLIGNEDAHGKNLALLYLPEGIRLSPHYDLVSTEVYAGLDRRLAMNLGAATDVRNVQRSDWEQVGRALAVPAGQVRAWLLDQVAAVRGAMPPVLAGCVEGYGPSPVYQAIAAICERQATRLERELARAGR